MHAYVVLMAEETCYDDDELRDGGNHWCEYIAGMRAANCSTHEMFF